MSSAEKFVPRYTVSDYQHWEGDWELVEGVPIAMSPSPLGPHERAVARIARKLGNLLEEMESNCETYAGLDWIVNNENVFRPDVMVVCGEQPEKHLEKPPVIAVEVLSSSTRLLDLGSKRRIYGDNGVAVYLIVDVEKKSIEIVDFAKDTTVEVNDIAKFEAGELKLELNLEDVFR